MDVFFFSKHLWHFIISFVEYQILFCKKCNRSNDNKNEIKVFMSFSVQWSVNARTITQCWIADLDLLGTLINGHDVHCMTFMKRRWQNPYYRSLLAVEILFNPRRLFKRITVSFLQSGHVFVHMTRVGWLPTLFMLYN